MASGSESSVICSETAWGYVELSEEEIAIGRGRIGNPEINLTAVRIYHILKTRVPELSASLTLTHLKAATSILEQLEQAILRGAGTQS